MIINYKVKNYKTFADEINISFEANGQIKRFLCNTTNVSGFNVLKSIGVYGPNNTGKTCLTLSFINLKNLMLNLPHENLTNSFINNDVISYEVEFCIDTRFYRYSISYDCKLGQYIKEQYCKIKTHPSNKYSKVYDVILERNTHNGIIYNNGKETITINNISSTFPMVVMSSFNDSKDFIIAKKDYEAFARSLELVRLDNTLNPSKTITLCQNDMVFRKFLTEFVKNADLHIDDFGYSENNIVSDVNITKDLFFNPSINKEYYKFYSKHNGYNVPSFLFDSLGTKKIIELSGYIYEAMKNGSILIIDEISNSFHHILTRAIIAAFNNLLNNKAQLIFTTHDLALMDLEHLLRKDQIYLTDISKETNHSVIIRLSDNYPSNKENGIRGFEDISKHYLKGKFGCLPSPDLYTSIEELLKNDK